MSNEWFVYSTDSLYMYDVHFPDGSTNQHTIAA